jgi:pimeloyl-ACP methyl ester carboxylesterase
VEILSVGDGVEIAYWDEGDRAAAPMVLLHATGESSETWRALVPYFVEEHRLIGVDLRGHGASGRPGEYSLELMSNDVLSVLDQLALRQATLVGHSLGGVVALLVAASRPDVVVRLVLEDACPPYARDATVPDRPPGEMSFGWDLVAPLRAELNDPSRRFWPRLKDITAPTLVIGGGPQSPVPQHLLAEVVSTVPDADLTTIAVGHMIHDEALDQFVDVLRRWLDRHPLP